MRNPGSRSARMTMMVTTRKWLGGFFWQVGGFFLGSEVWLFSIQGGGFGSSHYGFVSLENKYVGVGWWIFPSTSAFCVRWYIPLWNHEALAVGETPPSDVNPSTLPILACGLASLENKLCWVGLGNSCLILCIYCFIWSLEAVKQGLEASSPAQHWIPQHCPFVF